MNKKNLFIVNGYELDNEQKTVVKDNSQNLLVIASAGSGKSLTIVGKIKYLIETHNIKQSEILCISFTNDSCRSLENSIFRNGYEVKVLTFHKLALNILKIHKISFSIASEDLLEYITDEYFETIILNEPYYMYITLKLLKIRHKINDISKYYNKNKSSKELKSLKKQITKFIHLYKSNAYKNYYLEKIYYKEKNKILNKKTHLFILLCIKILVEYNKELNSQNKVDFDDMISMSTNILKTSTKKLNFKYIFIDEFQDTSKLRYNLIKEIINKTNAKLIAVGDDYQSIYRFSGCDLSLFINFNKTIKKSKTLKIQTTYRNSKELSIVSTDFVKKNPMQIKKQIMSSKKCYKPIKIIYYENQHNTFIQLLKYLYKSNEHKILILGRNNNEIYKVINQDFEIKKDGEITYKKIPELKIRYLTVHKSKGLEEETVIVLSLENNNWSFPNKTQDLKVFNHVLSKQEKYPYAEERRLFYVALTRTKNKVYLLTNKNNPSIFVKEILKESKKHIEIRDLQN